MLISGVILFFSLWFLISILYIIDRNSLGSIGKWLHRNAWVNEWSMFTNQNLSNKKFKVLFTDFNSNEELLEWQEFNLYPIKYSNVILNPNFKLQFFVYKCIKKITAARRLDKESALDQDTFNYLCALIIQIPSKKGANFRKIKIVKLAEEETLVELISSNPFRI